MVASDRIIIIQGNNKARQFLYKNILDAIRDRKKDERSIAIIEVHRKYSKKISK